MAKPDNMMTPFSVFEAMTGDQGDAVRKGMERAMSVTGDFGNLSRDGLTAASECAKLSAKGLKDINDHAVSYARSAYSAGMEASKSISSAKSVQEAMEAQAEYAKGAMDAYFREMGDLMTLAAGSMREALEPLNAHASHVVEKFQSAS